MNRPPGDDGVRDHFREVMAGVPTPVSVVTSLDDGRPHGTTVSAFASLSMAPPMVLVALDHRSDLLAVVRRTNRFGLNVLGSDQAALATAFARKGGSLKFTGVLWETADGVPRLLGARGFLGCAVARVVDGGDHVVLLADVRVADSGTGHPLTYYSRDFGTHVALDAVRP
ncbi:flavin reductase family protein [Blastococcus sp. MG754426]|uniref:flavin reductase family protein n=1 Tax=unclassified Blastococcus TaxID=2619396 RepID=UPI001EEF8E74|nr:MULTISPECIES: flavin reductase family protein [unclassified Blastococcus]MCF6509957.1 flavin reductase family protein [Blastococcus sp. MG754426]MCF6513522.1 flavin reductase family protein [Blastococcus sp. MG754427]MCF6737526.1 flavin reductase family protein [Blastococcus sp. KM273129]